MCDQQQGKERRVTRGDAPQDDRAYAICAPGTVKEKGEEAGESGLELNGVEFVCALRKIRVQSV
jgi:hypothetical protein